MRLVIQAAQTLRIGKILLTARPTKSKTTVSFSQRLCPPGKSPDHVYRILSHLHLHLGIAAAGIGWSIVRTRKKWRTWLRSCTRPPLRCPSWASLLCSPNAVTTWSRACASSAWPTTRWTRHLRAKNTSRRWRAHVTSRLVGLDYCSLAPAQVAAVTSCLHCTHCFLVYCRCYLLKARTAPNFADVICSAFLIKYRPVRRGPGRGKKTLPPPPSSRKFQILA